MERRSFLKSLALGFAALATPALTATEAKEAAKIETPTLPSFGRKAYVTTCKGPTATINHRLNKPNVFVVAHNLDNHARWPRVTPIDRDHIKLDFAEPWSITGRRKIYKVVVFC